MQAEDNEDKFSLEVRRDVRNFLASLVVLGVAVLAINLNILETGSQGLVSATTGLGDGISYWLAFVDLVLFCGWFAAYSCTLVQPEPAVKPIQQQQEETVEESFVDQRGLSPPEVTHVRREHL